MLKVLGWLFIIVGVLMCLSFFFMAPGFTAVLIGAVLLIADALRSRRRRSEEQGL